MRRPAAGAALRMDGADEESVGGPGARAEPFDGWRGAIGRADAKGEAGRQLGQAAADRRQHGHRSKGDQRFANVRVAVQDDQLALGNDVGPEPGHGFDDDAVGEDDGHGSALEKGGGNAAKGVTSCARDGRRDCRQKEHHRMRRKRFSMSVAGVFVRRSGCKARKTGRHLGGLADRAEPRITGYCVAGR